MVRILYAGWLARHLGVVGHMGCLELPELFSVNGMESTLEEREKIGWECRLGPDPKGKCMLRPLEFILQALRYNWRFLIKEMTYSGLSFRRFMQATEWGTGGGECFGAATRVGVEADRLTRHSRHLGNLLKLQIHRPHRRPTEPESPGEGTEESGF